LPREDVKKEPRSFDDEEMRRIIAAAPEPLGTVVAITVKACPKLPKLLYDRDGVLFVEESAIPAGTVR